MKHTNKALLVGVSSLMLLLTGCQSAAKEAVSLNEKVDTATKDLQAQFLELTEYEDALQAQFEKTLEEDETFETLVDESSPLFENINGRTEVLENMQGTHDTLVENISAYEALDMSDLPEQEVESLKTDLAMASEQLNEFIDFYTQSLSTQKAYFTSLAEETATYDTFISGIQSVNEEQEAIREKTLELDTTLASLEAKENTLTKMLTEDAN